MAATDVLDMNFATAGDACFEASELLECYTFKARDERGDWMYTCVDPRRERVLMLSRESHGRFVWVVASRMQ